MSTWALSEFFEALTGIIENLWNPDAGLVHAIQESRQILQTSSVILSQEGERSLGCRVGRRTGFRVVGSGRRRSRGDGGLQGGTCSRRAVGRSDSVKGTQSCNEEYTGNTAAEEDTHRGASGCGAGCEPAVLAAPNGCQLEPC